MMRTQVSDSSIDCYHSHKVEFNHQEQIIEVWKNIPNYEGFYQASSLGNIRSLDRFVNCRGSKKKLVKSRLYKPQNGLKYLQITLNKENKAKTHPIHRLITLTFIGERPHANAVIRHLNGNPKDNSLKNLCYGTYVENEADKNIHGTTAWGEKVGTSKLKLNEIFEIKKIKATGVTSQSIAIKFNVSKSTICRIINGITWARSSHAVMRKPLGVPEQVELFGEAA